MLSECHYECRVIFVIGLYCPPDGITNPKYKSFHFLTTKLFCKEKKALAFNWDRCCHRVLCLQLILFLCAECCYAKCRGCHLESSENCFIWSKNGATTMSKTTLGNVYAECRNETDYFEWRYANCLYYECRGAFKTSSKST
jgi:hypothetical protein